MDTILHVTTLADWAAAQASGLHAPAMLAADGFLHFCTAAQLDYVLGKHFAGRTGLVLLTCDPAQVGDLRWEESVPGQPPFPHVYGPLPVAAVLNTRELTTPSPPGTGLE